MANALFNAYKVRLLGGNTNSLIDWDADTVKVILIDSADDTISTSSDDMLDDVAAAARVATATLASVTISSAGVIDAADTTFTSVSGDQSEQLVIYKDTGVESTSPLAVFFDTFTSGMPITPNGGNIIISWNASGIFAL